MFASDISARVEAMVTMAPLRFPQRFFGGAGEEECRGQIGVDDAMPFGQRQAANGFADHNAGIGNDGIEPAEAADDRVDRIRHGFFIAHIAVNGERIAVARRIGPAQSAVRQVDHADAPAGIEQMLRNGAADTVRPSGYQGDGILRVAIRDWLYLSRSTGKSGREPHSAQEPS